MESIWDLIVSNIIFEIAAWVIGVLASIWGLIRLEYQLLKEDMEQQKSRNPRK